MIHSTFTSLTFLALFASERPAEFRHDPERIATIAIAAERAQSAVIAQWHRHPRLLGAALAVTVLRESNLLEGVHSGEVRGPTDDVCLVQINRGNTIWRNWAESRDALAGLDIVPTSACLGAGLETLMAMDRYCAQRPRRNWLAQMFSGYAGTRCRLTGDALSRAAETNRLAWTDWQPTDAHAQAVAWALNSERVAFVEGLTRI